MKPSRFGISPDARMCRHLGNMAEAGLYDDLQEMFVPRSRIKLGECVGIGNYEILYINKEITILL